MHPIWMYPKGGDRRRASVRHVYLIPTGKRKLWCKIILHSRVALNLDFFNILLALNKISATLSWLAHLFQIWLAFSLSRILLLGWLHENLGSATSHLFSLIYIGFRFATELASKLLRLLPGCYNLSSHPISHHSSHDMCRCWRWKSPQ